MPKLPPIACVADIHLGKAPMLEAWLYHFLTENNIEHLLNPSIVASPEQLRFMVALKDDQIYLPCSDEMFFEFYNNNNQEKLLAEYLRSWKFIVGLVRSYTTNKSDYRRILGFCRYRFGIYLSSHMILPSRMIKRLVNTVLTQYGNADPFQEKKRNANARTAKLLASPTVQHILQQCPTVETVSRNISDVRWELDYSEMSRLLVLSTLEETWHNDVSSLEIEAEVAQAENQCSPLQNLLRPDGTRKKILFLPDVSGGFMCDLAFIKSLLRQGHQVILAVKDSFYFNAPTISDTESDPILKQALEDALVLDNYKATKNELLKLLREHQFMLLSDGSSEQLNLYRTSTSFARAWKESDIVIAKGRRNKQVLVDSSHEFTRDIVCFWRDDNNSFHLETKARAKWVHKFSEKDLLAKAKEIITEMLEARLQGKTVMFYSAVIGSIPGQTSMAIKVVNTFVHNLRDKMENVLIINPAEHFEEGMDGDDLMYMWEHVQRSGYLQVWRFQTVEDIETSFALMERKVPSVWSGKDSTFSTGCTKEMLIALDVQKHHPELQIIGPAAEKFFRRQEYGVGKYFDAQLKGQQKG